MPWATAAVLAPVDCWPAVRSWTIVDYALRRTPAFHPVRRAMAPLHVIIIEEGDEIRFIGINDTPGDVDATLTQAIVHLAGGDVIRKSLPVKLAANSATMLATLPRSLWSDPNTQCPIATLHDSAGKLLARNKLLDVFFKDMRWPEAKIEISLRDGHATFTSSSFCWRIALDLDGETALADNFFDLFPGEPYTIEWPHPSSPKVLFLGNQLGRSPGEKVQ